MMIGVPVATGVDRAPAYVKDCRKLARLSQQFYDIFMEL
jgi:hypothetical protein